MTADKRRKRSGQGRKSRKSGRPGALRLITGNLLFAAALIIFCYPDIMNIINMNRSAVVVNAYDTAAKQRDADEAAAERERCALYNERLPKGSGLINSGNDERDGEYEALMNISGDGSMCVIRIPKISVELPVYHYSTEDVLEKGAGHIHGSSLPVGAQGDEGTNTVLTGHRGLPGNLLFTRLDELAEGDEIYIDSLADVLTYSVSEVKTVSPEDTGDIVIEPGKDMITLVTCTPYGVNSERLIILADRQEKVGAGYAPDPEKDKKGIRLPLTRLWTAGAAVIVMAAAEVVIWKRRGKKQKEAQRPQRRVR